MHVRRLACLLLGMWLAGSGYLGVVAAQNFLTIDRLLKEPRSSRATVEVEKLGGPEQARLFLRHYVGEQNRFYFQAWEITQMILGGALFLLLLFGTREGKLALLLVLAMLLLVFFLHFGVTPGLVGLGRELDFTPPIPDSPLRAAFRARHVMYSTLEVVKVVIGVGLAVLLVAGRATRRLAVIGEPLATAGSPQSGR